MRTWKFGDNIDTDAIIPGRYLVYNDPRVLSSHAFEGTRNDFAKGVSPGDVIIAGRNFGCGSSREHAPLALAGAGVRFIVAKSFARIFYRNAVNVGMLPLVCPDTGSIPDGEECTVDLEKRRIVCQGRSYAIEPVPDFLLRIADAGGLIAYARNLSGVETCTGSQR
ncbi:MAG: 3-isopropylmalate dehydratase small subunit [Methanoregulaceae archaeon]|jgi:3-isopropylmalate/(R)-2-methylmalate dehydratase small subunit|nr:3-isopropylmalate dehydratase small subunit [Methanoregulaceae archaeon]MCU0627963.1 3-isopropylmalate dehydratase small subunit [Methanoregulaceae archaeon]